MRVKSATSTSAPRRLIPYLRELKNKPNAASRQKVISEIMINSLKPGGRCGIVLDEGVLFRTNETAFVQTKRKLLDDCDLYCIVSVPGGVFSAAGAGVKTNPLFFTKGGQSARARHHRPAHTRGIIGDYRNARARGRRGDGGVAGAAGEGGTR